MCSSSSSEDNHGKELGEAFSVYLKCHPAVAKIWGEGEEVRWYQNWVDFYYSP